MNFYRALQFHHDEFEYFSKRYQLMLVNSSKSSNNPNETPSNEGNKEEAQGEGSEIMNHPLSGISDSKTPINEESNNSQNGSLIDFSFNNSNTNLSMSFDLEENEKLKKKIEQLNEESSKEKSNLQKLITQKDQEIESLKRELQSSKMQTEEKSKEAEILCNKLQQALQSYNKELEKYKRQITDLKDMNSLKTTQVKKLKESNDFFINDLKEKDKKIESLQNNLNSYQQHHTKNNQEKNDLQEKLNQSVQQYEVSFFLIF